jgi:hypothetical protein
VEVGEWLCKCKTLNAADATICVDCQRRRGSWFRSTWVPALLIVAVIIAIIWALQYYADHVGT